MSFGRIMITAGVFFLVMGLIVEFGGKSFPLGKLPGDILIKKENINIYIPLTTSLLVSAFLSLLAFIFRK